MTTRGLSLFSDKPTRGLENVMKRKKFWHGSPKRKKRVTSPPIIWHLCFWGWVIRNARSVLWSERMLRAQGTILSLSKSIRCWMSCMVNRASRRSHKKFYRKNEDRLLRRAPSPWLDLQRRRRKRIQLRLPGRRRQRSHPDRA